MPERHPRERRRSTRRRYSGLSHSPHLYELTGDKAGIKNDDIITQIEGQTIDQNHPLEDMLVQYAPGRTISVQLYRGGKYVTVSLTLGTRPTG